MASGHFGVEVVYTITRFVLGRYILNWTKGRIGSDEQVKYQVKYQRYWPDSFNNRGWSRPVSKYIPYIVNEFRYP